MSKDVMRVEQVLRQYLSKLRTVGLRDRGPRHTLGVRPRQDDMDFFRKRYLAHLIMSFGPLQIQSEITESVNA